MAAADILRAASVTAMTHAPAILLSTRAPGTAPLPGFSSNVSCRMPLSLSRPTHWRLRMLSRAACPTWRLLLPTSHGPKSTTSLRVSSGARRAQRSCCSDTSWTLPRARSTRVWREGLVRKNSAGFPGVGEHHHGGAGQKEWRGPGPRRSAAGTQGPTIQPKRTCAKSRWSFRTISAKPVQQIVRLARRGQRAQTTDGSAQVLRQVLECAERAGRCWTE